MKNIVFIICLFSFLSTALHAQDVKTDKDATTKNLAKDAGFSDIQLEEGGELFFIDANTAGQLVFRRNGSQTDETYIFDDNLRIFAIRDASNVDKLSAQVLSTGEGFLQTYGANGNANTRLTTLSGDPNKGFLVVAEENGNARVNAFASSAGPGVVNVFGDNGERNVQLSYSSAGEDNGWMGVVDAANTSQAGAFVDSNGDGVIFGDVKNFKVDHPTRSDKDIWFACVEGPEVAAYERGTAQLVNGEVFINFSEHFGLLASTESMTVALTPLDSDTYGLAVIEKNENGFRVKELKHGQGNFEFDWEVKCVRKGYENFQVIRDKNDGLPMTELNNTDKLGSEPDYSIKGDTEPGNNN